MTFTASEVRAYCAVRVPRIQMNTSSREWRAPCPVHQGERDSFSVNSETGLAQCHSECGRGWDMISLEMALSRTDFVKAKAEVFRIVGRPQIPWDERDIEAFYDYRDENGVLKYQVVRKAGKNFVQRRPDGNGKWIWKINGLTPLPFNLAAILKPQLVAIVEGEKDALNLTKLGMPATCNNGGANNSEKGACNFKPDLAPWFIGKDVAIFPDNDLPGRRHAVAVARLLHGKARSVKIVDLPGLQLKGDVSDFIAKGGTLDEINALYVKTVEWSPDFDFATSLPRKNDRYIKTFAQVVEEAGGFDAFWDLTKWSGVETPFPKLNRKLRGGLKNGELFILGGNQGAGKTSLALQFCLTVLKKNENVLFFSMEMNHCAVFQRLAGIEGRVNLAELYEKQFQNHDFREERSRLNQACTMLAKENLQVSNKARVTAEDIVAEIEHGMKQRPISLVVIDHMQLMNASTSSRNRYEKLTEVAHAMKQTALAVNKPILLLSQTTRANEKERRDLEMSDLRDTGAAEEAADGILLIYEDRDDAKTAKNVKDGRRYVQGPVKAWLKIAKNRFGEQGGCLPILHYKGHARFELEEEGRE